MKKIIVLFTCFCLSLTFVGAVFADDTNSNINISKDSITDDYLVNTKSENTEIKDNKEYFVGEYMVEDAKYNIEVIRDIKTHEIIYIKVADGKNVSTYNFGNDYIDYNGEKLYFTIDEISSIEPEFKNSESFSSSLVDRTNYTWMPIRTTWYTYHLSDYISTAPTSTIASLFILGFSGPWSKALGAAIIIRDYHYGNILYRYKTDWKMKRQYCGAQGYYGKYAHKYWHYTIDGVYIPGTYSLYELY